MEKLCSSKASFRVRISVGVHIEMYPLTLISCRKGNWSHKGSTPFISTNFINMETDKKDYEKIYSLIAQW